MTQLFFNKDFHSPFDILVKNFFDSNSVFDSPTNRVVSHPIDVFENKDGLTFEVACTGLGKDDVDIKIEGDVLKISYDKGERGSGPSNSPDYHYYHSGIKKSNFNLGWKVSRRFNLSEIKANMKNGLLTLTVPYSDESKPKSIKIK